MIHRRVRAGPPGLSRCRLLIGGDHQQGAHAVKIAPAYRHAVVHVLDASGRRRDGALKSPEQRDAYACADRADQERLRKAQRAEREDKPMLPLAEARRRRTPLDWSGYDPPKPSFLGVRVFDPYPLAELVPFIDWSPFFHTWELKGTYPRIFENPTWGARAKELFDDARRLLQRIVDEGRLTARAAMGFYPAASQGDDILIYTDQTRSKVRATSTQPCAAEPETADQPNQLLADFVAPPRPGCPLPRLVTVHRRHRHRAVLEEFERGPRRLQLVMTKALADRLRGAGGGVHRKAREEWGYGRDEALASRTSSASGIAASVRPRDIRPAPTTRRSGPCSTCSRPRRRSACTSRRASPCTPPRR